MRRKILISLFVILLMFSITACIDDSKEMVETGEQEKISVSDASEVENEVLETLEPDDPEKDYSHVKIVVYYSDDEAASLISEEVEITKLSPENILEVLIEKEALQEDIRITSFETLVADGKKSIEIDFNSEFLAYIMNLGSTGEYFTLASICNTFLDAYNCEQIKITVEGDILSTGHADYPTYMGVFQ